MEAEGWAGKGWTEEPFLHCGARVPALGITHDIIAVANVTLLDINTES